MSRRVGLILFLLTLGACTTAAEPVPPNAVAIEQAGLPADLEDWLGSTQENDLYYSIPVNAQGSSVVVLARVRPGTPPLMFATACSVLVQHDLPAGWEGQCNEVTRDGSRVFGPFSYEEALAESG